MAGSDASSQNLVEQIDVDLTELLLKVGHKFQLIRKTKQAQFSRPLLKLSIDMACADPKQILKFPHHVR
jgi:hypothetical protein